MSDARMTWEGTLDSHFDILAVEERRHVIRSLRDRERPVSLADLVKQVAARKHATDIEDVSDEAVQRVYLGLYHTHVPKMAEQEFVEFNSDRGTVALTERAKPLLEILETVETELRR